ncbi:thiopurine S-methyltransferase [Shewanella sp. CG12_big_fil_rev_8_21_14_0_65_47_15]|uniref:thiopurine S-methyltransferase n=1 Tax=Shewanella sp. CG12_big_fil_rev_8_21_14_0_65_47_15 TaxID=1975537 RepID=UPI000CADEF31|nr:thiopurine S-methyltransferase [Shewanella sp. CG12_big_fil_rev_8_21_14_0_65_47_15]PIW60043.1 MAG: thiopurine S-methyltransferase [Shewanella sp. CG12_big_fil_rev_8_21_14_0_65_47_15]
MEPGFWHDKWHQQQIGFHQQDINPFLIKYWQKLALPAAAKVFVPLCGKSLDMCFLAEQGHQVIGCELNELAVQQFFSDNQLEMTKTAVGEHQHYQTEQISLYQGDIFTLPNELTQDVTAFYDRAALIAWPESMRAQYAKQLASLLPSGSLGLLVTLDYPQEALNGPPFAVSPTWVEQHLSDDFEIQGLDCQDVLADNPRFIKKEVPWLNEAAYLLKRK